MIQVISAGGKSGGSYAISAPIMGTDFTWDGGDNTCMVLEDGDGNWRIKFLSSGTFTPLKNMLIDVFLVGGGAGGSTTKGGGGAGGGGYTKTVKSIALLANTAYAIVVGANGAESTDQAGTSSAFGASAAGGFGGKHSANPAYGGSGGSRGTTVASHTELAGGTDGSNGSTNSETSYPPGIGQGTTTREFGEASGTLYANGGPMSTKTDNSHSFVAPQPNTGDGGGAWYSNGFPGASGIVIIRKHKEDAA